MTDNMVDILEERVSILEFKLELMLKITKNDFVLTLENCKTMDEFAFVNNLKKSEYEAIIALLSKQISFYQSFNKQPYMSPRQYFKSDLETNILDALSKDEFENEIWSIVPKFKGNQDICKLIAKINGITEMYYDDLALEIKKAQFAKLDKETKLKTSYKENKDEVDNLYNEVDLLKQELKANLIQAGAIIHFFEENDLKKISIFYNGELWDRSNDDKQVVINEDTYIHNVCETKKENVLADISNILLQKEHPFKDLLVFLLKSSNKSSKKIEGLQEFYKLMTAYNKNEHVQIDEVVTLKEKIESNIKVVDEILNGYNEYVSSL